MKYINQNCPIGRQEKESTKKMIIESFICL